MLSTGENYCEEGLLEGHLGITKELLAFMLSEKKHHVGSKNDGCQLIKVGVRGDGSQETVGSIAMEHGESSQRKS